MWIRVMVWFVDKTPETFFADIEEYLDFCRNQSTITQMASFETKSCTSTAEFLQMLQSNILTGGNIMQMQVTRIE